MFDSLIDVSRLEQGAVTPIPGDIELDPLLERLADEAEPAARAKSLELRRAATGLRVRSDPVLLGRILQNLLVNAVRYTRKGHVALSAVQHGGEVHISVSDSGPGIPEERREAIFAEFVRLHEDASVQGLGLGLSIVERLVSCSATASCSRASRAAAAASASSSRPPARVLAAIASRALRRGALAPGRCRGAGCS